ncbi:TPA: hypothetical protein ACKP5H_004497 [Stenotrophomonas maltophilia]
MSGIDADAILAVHYEKRLAMWAQYFGCSGQRLQHGAGLAAAVAAAFDSGNGLARGGKADLAAGAGKGLTGGHLHFLLGYSFSRRTGAPGIDNIRLQGRFIR